MMTMGSLFDGIGGFPLAAVLNGIKPLWASEIEAFPIQVTKIRFPEMLHVGDITKLDGAILPPVDIICGGSPCQDLSVAGQRAGLAGERSGLFMEQTRITKEMRKSDEQRNVPAHLIRPRYLVWENVPGAFSSAEGEDFRAVIEEIVRIKYSACDVPQPESGRWQSAGAAILGDEFSLAWRVLDAQFWGVAQRRRRIFLVADFGGTTAPEILFKQDSLLGYLAESRSQRQGAAAPAQGGTDDTGRACLSPRDVQTKEKTVVGFDGYNGDLTGEQAATLGVNCGMSTGRNGVITSTAFAANQREKVNCHEVTREAALGCEVRDLHDVAGAIQAQPGMKQQTFIASTEKINAFHVNQRDEVIDLDGVSGALLATRNMQMQTFITEPLICLNDHGGGRMDITEEVTPTLRAGMGGHPPLVAQPSYVLIPETVETMPAEVDGDGERGQTEAMFAAGFCGSASGDARGIGFQEECAPTLKTGTAPSVLCLNDQGGSQMHCTENITGTLRAQEHGHQPLIMATQQGGAEIGEGICPTITSAAGASGNNQPVLFENHAKDCRYTGPLEVAPTVTSTYGTGGNNVPLVGNSDLQEAICIAGNTIDREPENGGNGLGCQQDISYTITTSDRHAVYEPYQDVVGALCRGDEKGIGSQYVSQDKCIVENRNLIRRLTPLECERLQGFPDGWTLIPGASDSARYKALGNSVAIPCVDFVLRGIAYFLRKIHEEQEE